MASETTIRAPIPGVVAMRYSDIGSMVGPQFQVFEIVKTDPMKVSIGVNEEDIASVIQGGEVLVTVDAYPDESFKGVVHNIGVKADPRTHAFPVEIQLDNPDGRLKSGMVAHVRLPILDLGEVLTIPINAAVKIQGVDYIFIVKEVVEEATGMGEDGRPGPSEPQTMLRVEKRAAILGPVADHRVVVLEGLEPGEEIVTEGQQFLEDGSLITIPDRDGGAGAEPASGEVE